MFRHFIVLFLALAPACAWAGPPLSLERAQQLAVAGQPALGAIAANTRALRESAVAEGQLPDPRLKIGLLNVPDDSFALNRDGMTTTMVAVEQTFPGGAKRALRQRRTETEAAQSEAEARSRHHEIRRDAGLAFLDASAVSRRLTLLGALEAEAAREVDAARIAHAAGKSSQSAVLAARQMLTMIRDRADMLRGDEARARAELSRWIGAAGREALEPALPAWGPLPPLEAMTSELLRHPAHAAQARSVAMAEADLALAREAGSPDKSVEIGYGVRSRQFGNMLSVQFSMDLPLAPKDRQQRGVAARQALVERAQALQEDHLRMLNAELAAAHAAWQTAGERLARFDSQLLPDAALRVEAELANYRSGRGELAAVLEARRAEIEARLKRDAVATEQARARLQLAWFEHGGEEHEAQR